MHKKKKDSSICCPPDTHFRSKDTHRLKLKRWEKIFHATSNDKKSGEAILTLDKRDLNTKTVKRDKGHCIMMKGSIKEEHIIMVNIYTPT